MLQLRLSNQQFYGLTKVRLILETVLKLQSLQYMAMSPSAIHTAIPVCYYTSQVKFSYKCMDLCDILCSLMISIVTLKKCIPKLHACSKRGVLCHAFIINIVYSDLFCKQASKWKLPAGLQLGKVISLWVLKVYFTFKYLVCRTKFMNLQMAPNHYLNHQYGSVTFIWWQFHKRYVSHQSLKLT